jgi:DNA-binding transcriptional LysR family regulator
MATHRASTWLAETVPGARVVARNASVLGVLTAVKAGIGIAPLPTTIADSEPGLVQVLPPVPALQRGWYLLTRPDLRRQPRIAALFDHLLAELPALQRVLMG